MRFPIGIYVLVAYLALSGLLTAGVGVYGMSVGQAIAVESPANPVGASGALLVLMGILLFVTAAGLWRHHAWARYAVAAFAAVNILMGFVQLVRGDFLAFLSIVVSSAVLYYVLFHPPVLESFSRGKIQRDWHRKAKQKAHRHL